MAGWKWRQGATRHFAEVFPCCPSGSRLVLDHWSDRALTLATTVFRDLPFAYTAEQAVTEVLSRFA
ncbi:hypothetical protein DPMN_120610 [Dreissena polymorpha]|uniref:Uncharacterized protein n=1 Tax=Dreissena polymorpha TaxID=45954 RepID=A0A9D4JSA4_DREPO|nr:hypothetical protein DPMN_120610 [Dreissena polymorpha]